MPSTPDEVWDYLNPEEPLVAEYTATQSKNAIRTPVSVGITDRRVLCVSEQGEATSIGHNSVSMIRSRPSVKRTYHGHDYRLFLAGGGTVAILGLIGVMAFSTTVLVPLLAFLTIGGLGSTEYFRRNSHVGEQALPVTLRQKDGGLNRWDGLQRVMSRLMDYTDDRRILLAGSGLVGIVSFIGAILVASSSLITFSILMLITGVTVMDFAYRHRDDFDGIHVIKQQENEVSISTIAGPTIHINSDPSDDVHRELSRLAFANGKERNQTVSTPLGEISTRQDGLNT